MFSFYFIVITVIKILYFYIPGAYYTLNKYLTLRNIDNSTMTKAEFEFTTEFSKYAELETTWLILFIITVTIFLVCLLVLIFLRKRINIAIALIGQASKLVSFSFTSVSCVIHMVVLCL